MSAVFTADNRDVVLHGCSLQLIGWHSLGASEFLYCGNAGPVSVAPEIRAQLLRAAEALVHGGVCHDTGDVRESLRGVFGLDFILRDGRVWVLELNPRIPASHGLYELQDPGRLIRQHITAFGWRTPAEKRHRRNQKTDMPVEARLIVWANREFVVPNDFTADRMSAVADRVCLADLPRPGSRIPNGCPVCSVIVHAVTLEEAVRRIRHLNVRCPGNLQMFIDFDNVARDLQTLIRRFENSCQYSCDGDLP